MEKASAIAAPLKTGKVPKLEHVRRRAKLRHGASSSSKNAAARAGSGYFAVGRLISAMRRLPASTPRVDAL